MNFYSDKIINNIIDNSPTEDILDLIEKFVEKSFLTIARYSIHDIQYKYIFNILKDKQNIIAFYCIDNEFNMENSPSILVYNKSKNLYKSEIIYYILLICTKRKFRNQGYASKLLDDFIERIKKENRNKLNFNIKVILSSVEESVTFYESYGFKWMFSETIDHHSILSTYEKFDPKKEYFIMELNT
jgi:ribosomal protein S18 acetylase RimI-like enzyme